MSNTLSRLNDQQYKAIDALNYSSFKHFLTSPKHYKQHLSVKDEPTPAMKLGTAIHSAVLTPSEFRDNYMAAPICDRRTKEGKQIWQEFTEEHGHKNIISTDELFTILGIQQSFNTNQFFYDAYVGAIVENVGVGELFGVPVKGRIDLYNSEKNIIIDIKSLTGSPTLENCRKAVFTNGYHIQAYFYSMIIKQISGKTPDFVFAFVEKEEPYSIGYVRLSNYWMNLAGNIVEKEINRFANCKLLDKWQSFEHSDIPHTISPWEERTTDNIPQHLID